MSEAVPEYFSDVFHFSFSPYGLAIAFGTRAVRAAPGPAPAEEDRVVVRMSLEQAKVLSMLLRKSLRQYEEAAGVSIELPPTLYEELELDPHA